MKALILAGGSGTRFWPLSRQNYPKQFLKLNGDKSLFQQTVERLMRVLPTSDIIIMTNNEYKFHVLSDLTSLPLPLPTIILEPVRKNTAPAIALGVKYCLEKLGCKEEEVVFVSPSDHIIKPVDKFVEYLKLSESIAKEGYIITFGIKPTKPETGYGYIKTGEPINNLSYHSEPPPELACHPEFISGSHVSASHCYKVEKFVEKPDIETAREYLKEGNYFWNSGIFAFSLSTIMEEFQRHIPEIKKMLDISYDEMIANFNQMPDISLDYAVAEKSNLVVNLPLNLYWNDLGSWDSLYETLDKDEQGNVIRGDTITIDTRETMVIGNKRLISTIGMEDCFIVETDDAILITKKGETQKVKEIVNKLMEANRKEASEHLTTYRPWGSFTVLEEGPRYKIKRVMVYPKEKLSLQLHHHRSEHWVVVKGTAKITIDNKEILLHENESAYVPKSALHRLENPGKIPLEIIEVQNGEYLGEDDIVRVEDHYGREEV